MTNNRARRQYELVLGKSTAAHRVHRNGNFWLYEGERGWGDPEPEVKTLYVRQEVLGDSPPERVRITLDWQE